MLHSHKITYSLEELPKKFIVTQTDKSNGNQLINSHASAILKHFNISLNSENKCSSLIYWLPKLHKKLLMLSS